MQLSMKEALVAENLRLKHELNNAKQQLLEAQAKEKQAKHDEFAAVMKRVANEKKQSEKEFDKFLLMKLQGRFSRDQRDMLRAAGVSIPSY